MDVIPESLSIGIAVAGGKCPLVALYIVVLPTNSFSVEFQTGVDGHYQGMWVNKGSECHCFMLGMKYVLTVYVKYSQRILNCPGMGQKPRLQLLCAVHAFITV